MEQKNTSGISEKERKHLHFMAKVWNVIDRIFRLKLFSIRWEIPFGKDSLKIAATLMTSKQVFEFNEIIDAVVRATTKTLYNQHSVNIVSGFCYDTPDYKVEITLKKPFIKENKRAHGAKDIYSPKGLTA